MAFELTDFNRSYVPKGEYRGLFNVSRSDEASDSPRYYLFCNESGSYVIQRITTTAGVAVYEYYGYPRSGSRIDYDWANRASLSYVEYYQLFVQG